MKGVGLRRVGVSFGWVLDMLRCGSSVDE
jgi:hypothetical protein